MPLPFFCTRTIAIIDRLIRFRNDGLWMGCDGVIRSLLIIIRTYSISLILIYLFIANFQCNNSNEEVTSITSLFKKVKWIPSEMSKRSDIWNHFDDIGGDDKARCKFCRAEIGYRGGSTSALWKHAESKHTQAVQAKLLSASQSSTSGASSSSSMTITSMFGKTNITTARSERITGLIANMHDCQRHSTNQFRWMDGIQRVDGVCWTWIGLRCTMCENHQETTAVCVWGSPKENPCYSWADAYSCIDDWLLDHRCHREFHLFVCSLCAPLHSQWCRES